MNMISEWISGCLAAGPRKLLKCKLNPGALLGHNFLLQNTQSAGQNPNPASLDSLALLEKSGVFVHFLSDVNALDFLKGAGTGDAYALCGWEVARPLLGVCGREGGGARGGGGGGGARVPRVLVPRSGMEKVGPALCYLQYLFRTVKQNVFSLIRIRDFLIRVQIRIFLNSSVAFKMPTKK
jgi:hypothetical protein